MNVAGNGQMNENTNVLALFSNVQIELPDPLQTLLNEAEAEAWEEDEAPLAKTNGVMVTAAQFPDQSMFILDQQLAKLNQSLGRLKFYISDLDDLLPR